MKESIRIKNNKLIHISAIAGFDKVKSYFGWPLLKIIYLPNNTVRYYYYSNEKERDVDYDRLYKHKLHLNNLSLINRFKMVHILLKEQINRIPNETCITEKIKYKVEDETKAKIINKLFTIVLNFIKEEVDEVNMDMIEKAEFSDPKKVIETIYKNAQKNIIDKIIRLNLEDFEGLDKMIVLKGILEEIKNLKIDNDVDMNKQVGEFMEKLGMKLIQEDKERNKERGEELLAKEIREEGELLVKIFENICEYYKIIILSNSSSIDKDIEKYIEDKLDETVKVHYATRLRKI